ncbi:MAG: hypothetical protein RLZZ458_1449, partial [Planctomycetota bacterium]
MSTDKQSLSQAQSTEQSFSLLDQITSAMPKSVQRNEGEDLVRAVVDAALKGSVVWDKSVTKTLRAAIAGIDQQLSSQLAAIMHDPQFQKLEGSWRGLHHLVMNSETSKQLKLRVLNISKRELFKDLDRAVEFDQSQLFKKLYED